MNTFEICIMLLCVIHSNYAQGLRMIFQNTDTIADIPEQSISNQNDFGRQSLDVIPENTERRFNQLVVPDDEPRVVVLKQILSDVGDILADNSLENEERPPLTKRSSLFNHLRGAQFPPPSKWFPSEISYINMFSELFPAMSHRRFNTFPRKHTRYNFKQNIQHPFVTVPSKRKSAITPPSRDWCRLIGYRVCPRATKF